MDATFWHARERAQLLEVARAAGVPFFFLHCQAPDTVVKARLATRQRDPKAISDASWETYVAQKRDFEPPVDVPGAALVNLDTSGAPREVVARAMRGLYERVLLDTAAK